MIASDIFFNKSRKELTGKLVRESFPCFLDSTIYSCYIGFSNSNCYKVLTFCIKAAREGESPLLVLILLMQISVSVLYIPTSLFWPCADDFPNRTYLAISLIGFPYSRSLVDLLGKEEIFVFVFPSARQASAIHEVIQAKLNSVVAVIEYFALLTAALNIVSKLLSEGALATVV